jgi:hypothetical protein
MKLLKSLLFMQINATFQQINVEKYCLPNLVF